MPSSGKVRWRVLIDTAEESGFMDNGALRPGGGQHLLRARSVAVFEQQGGTADEARELRTRRMFDATRSAFKNATDRFKDTVVRREPAEPGQVL
jgi:hypothetical protein